MTNSKPIGLFDSGVGGSSIWKEIHHLLPSENTIYLADSKNAPYGIKTKEEILALSRKNTEYLINEGCKLIVVACNTATTNAIKELRSEYDIPFIGIEPAIKPAALKSKTGAIGVLATKGTLSSALFNEAVSSYSDTLIVEQIGYELVTLIENGQIESERMTELLELYMQPMIDQNVDYLVLGCTHYPYLIPQLKKILPSDIKIIDSGEAVARQTKKVLENIGFSDSLHPTNKFYINSSPEVLQQLIGNDFKAEYKAF